MKIENSDVVIVGSGVAGLICALTLSKKFKIILLTKKKLQDSNSYLAQGGISVCRGKEDREEYIEDTLIAGHYKNDKRAVEILVDESEEAVNLTPFSIKVFTASSDSSTNISTALLSFL